MATQFDVNYRRLVTLGDGARVLLRLLTAADRQALLDLYAPTTADDARYMRHDVRNPKLVESWIDEMDYDRVLPLVAVALITIKQPPLYGANARIITSSRVPASSAEADAIVRAPPAPGWTFSGHFAAERFAR